MSFNIFETHFRTFHCRLHISGHPIIGILKILTTVRNLLETTYFSFQLKVTNKSAVHYANNNLSRKIHHSQVVNQSINSDISFCIFVIAVYLCKRTMQNKTRLELVDYEAENLARLQKMFSRKWEFIFMQVSLLRQK